MNSMASEPRGEGRGGRGRNTPKTFDGDDRRISLPPTPFAKANQSQVLPFNKAKIPYLSQLYSTKFDKIRLKL